MAGTVTTNTKKYYGGLVPEPTPQGGGDGKTKVLVLRDVTVTVDEHPVTKKLLCDPDSVITVEPFIEVVTAEKLAEWLDDNYVILLDDGTQQVQMLKASVSSEGETPVCNSVVFKGLKDSKRASIEYPCQLLTDESTLMNFIEAGAAVIQEFNLVSAYPEDTTSGTLIDKLEIEDTIDDDPDYQPLLEIVPTNGKVAINEDGLHEALNELGGAIDSIVDTIDELDVDSVPHAYLHSTLTQSAGDSVTTSTSVNVFAQDALEGDCFEFEQTTTIDDTPFGYVWIEPGTYLINASVTLQWVGDPRGTFIAKVGSVMGENFDFSQEQEIKRNTTKIVTIPNRMKLSVNITYDAGTPVMGFWIQSMQVVKLAGGMSQTNITHDSTLTGQGSVADPLGVDTETFATKFDVGSNCTNRKYTFRATRVAFTNISPSFYMPVLKGQKVSVSVTDVDGVIPAGEIVAVRAITGNGTTTMGLASSKSSLNLEFTSDANYAGLQYVIGTSGAGGITAPGTLEISFTLDSPFSQDNATKFDVGANCTDREYHFRAGSIGYVNYSPKFYLPILKGQKVTVHVTDEDGIIPSGETVAVRAVTGDDSTTERLAYSNDSLDLEFTSNANYAGLQYVIGTSGAGGITASGILKISFNLETPFTNTNKPTPQQFNNIRKKIAGGFSVVPMPDNAFNDFFFPKLYYNGITYKVFIDSAKYKHTENSVVYVSPDGTGDGTSESTPADYKAIFTGGNLRENATYILLDGLYESFTTDRVFTIKNNVNVVAKNKGKAIVVSTDTSVSFIDEGDGLYSVTYSKPVMKVIQMDKTSGEVCVLSSVDDVSEVEEGIYYFDAVTRKLTFKPSFGKSLSDVYIISSLDYNTNTTNIPVISIWNNVLHSVHVYLEGITFIGGKGSTLGSGFANDNDVKPTLFAKDCRFLGAYDKSMTFDAVTIRGWDAVFVGCEASYSSKDGFNYHASSPKIPKFIEVGCKSYSCGVDGVAEGMGISGTSCNGSTSHDGVVGIRCDCEYAGNYGGQCADTSSAKTLNLGVVAYDSALPSSSIHNSAFDSIQSGTKMYCKNCVGFGCTNDYNAEQAGAYIYMEKCDYMTRGGHGNIVDQ